ncbi:MAG: hypothetical protein FWD14_06310 [Treponema sp.]|nr:hypothetical protein [Treponema sp.]
MKRQIFFILCLTIVFSGCAKKEEIVYKHFQYEKTFFDTYRIEMDIYLENIGNSRKAAKLVRQLIYQNKNFEEFIAYKENDFISNNYIGEIKSDIYPPRRNQTGLEYRYNSHLIESYNILFNDSSYIIIEFNSFYYYAYSPHGYFSTRYFIIDIMEERILDLADIISPIPDDILRIITEEHAINNYLRDGIWPPDSINIGHNVEFIWNIFTITPYFYATIHVEIPDEIGSLYLTEKGHDIISRVRSNIQTLIESIQP